MLFPKKRSEAAETSNNLSLQIEKGLIVDYGVLD